MQSAQTDKAPQVWIRLGFIPGEWTAKYNTNNKNAQIYFVH